MSRKNDRPVSAAGKRKGDGGSAGRCLDWQPDSAQNGRPRSADVSKSAGRTGARSLVRMRSAAEQSASEAQANAVRNGRIGKNGATSPKVLYPTLLSNDQTDYKRRHGLNLQTSKITHQWSHSGHFPGMTLSCWEHGCSKLWGCSHGVGDEELDRQLKLPEWGGRGNDPTVPEWLRYEGKIANRKLSKRFVLAFCQHVWKYKYPPPLIVSINGISTEVKREPRHGGLSRAFHECMKTTYGPSRLVAGVAYNMYYGLLRFRQEHADLDIFCRILTNELPSQALFVYMEEVEKLRGLLRAADADKKGRLPRAQVLEVFRQRFGAAFDEAQARAAAAAMDAAQPPVTVHPSWYLDPERSRKAAKINDVDYEKLMYGDRLADHGPFAQLAKELIVNELISREWPVNNEIIARPKYADFNAWHKARPVANAVKFLNLVGNRNPEGGGSEDFELVKRVIITSGDEGTEGDPMTPGEKGVADAGVQRGNPHG